MKALKTILPLLLLTLLCSCQKAKEFDITYPSVVWHGQYSNDYCILTFYGDGTSGKLSFYETDRTFDGPKGGYSHEGTYTRSGNKITIKLEKDKWFASKYNERTLTDVEISGLDSNFPTIKAHLHVDYTLGGTTSDYNVSFWPSTKK